VKITPDFITTKSIVVFIENMLGLAAHNREDGSKSQQDVMQAQ
jgi:hypothetical protein